MTEPARRLPAAPAAFEDQWSPLNDELSVIGDRASPGGCEGPLQQPRVHPRQRSDPDGHGQDPGRAVLSGKASDLVEQSLTYRKFVHDTCFTVWRELRRSLAKLPLRPCR